MGGTKFYEGWNKFNDEQCCGWHKQGDHYLKGVYKGECALFQTILEQLNLELNKIKIKVVQVDLIEIDGEWKEVINLALR